MTTKYYHLHMLHSSILVTAKYAEYAKQLVRDIMKVDITAATIITQICEMQIRPEWLRKM